MVKVNAEPCIAMHNYLSVHIILLYLLRDKGFRFIIICVILFCNYPFTWNWTITFWALTPHFHSSCTICALLWPSPILKVSCYMRLDLGYFYANNQTSCKTAGLHWSLKAHICFFAPQLSGAFLHSCINFYFYFWRKFLVKCICVHVYTSHNTIQK